MPILELAAYSGYAFVAACASLAVQLVTGAQLALCSVGTVWKKSQCRVVASHQPDLLPACCQLLRGLHNSPGCRQRRGLPCSMGLRLALLRRVPGAYGERCLHKERQRCLALHLPGPLSPLHLLWVATPASSATMAAAGSHHEARDLPGGAHLQ